MPYIGQEYRKQFDRLLSELHRLENAGELNYLISSICHRYLLHKPISYDAYNEVMGVLECAKLEIYRAVVAPYEDGKRRQNGPVSQIDKI